MFGGSIIPIFKDGVLFSPVIHQSVFLSPGSFVIGLVKIDEGSSVWYGSVIRGDVNWISIGRYTNIQDLCVIHAETASFPTYIGDFVTIGHRAVIHGCIVKDFCLIGMGAVIMNGAEVGPYAIVGAGALVPEDMKVPPGAVVVGSPAKIKRFLKEKEFKMFYLSAMRYFELSRIHKNSKK
ncbi:2,3,4,5-tetrahydropyridine-2,6-dicarboxylate N-acetyltransferase [bacterium HR19]|nr:2,3,4,5-tetrahydropyridine-2,6-dicarboxylate N-acetyltransferase [bacterium HR19]